MRLNADACRLLCCPSQALGLGGHSNATSAPQRPWTELRGNLAYYSILAARRVTVCNTLARRDSKQTCLRNVVVCLFYPGVSLFGNAPRKYSKASVQPGWS